MNDEYKEQSKACAAFSRKLGQNLAFFAIGAGIGATLGLLFAPKAGREVREDVADLAARGYEKSKQTANEVKQRVTELYESTGETGKEVINVVSAGALEIKKEVSSDARKIGSILGGYAHRATGFGSSFIL